MRSNCPSCGAEIDFQSKVSLYAVCGYCRCQVLRKDLDIERIGEVAELQEDGSPIQLGTRGRYREKGFSVIGRIQIRFPKGFWNEWFLEFDGGGNGWMGEAQGLYGICFEVPADSSLPSWDDLRVGKAISIQKHRYVVKEKQAARCIGGEGELPFLVRSGYEAPVVDLATSTPRFATIDYSEEEPIVFVGQFLEFDQLSFQDLRPMAGWDGYATKGVPALEVKSFQCVACGAALEIRSPGASEIVSCGNCGSTLDARDKDFRLLKQYDKKMMKRRVHVPLGSRGELLGNHELEVIGFLSREVVYEGISYKWGEYLLWSPYVGYRWLTESNGHWIYLWTCIGLPRRVGSSKPRYGGKDFKHFQKSNAKVIFCLGEFPWKIAVGDTSILDDFIAPHNILSRERNQDEVVWSVGHHLDVDVLWKTFGLDETKKKTPSGVGPVQPNPHGQTFRSLKWVFVGLLALLVLVQIVFSMMARNEKVFYKNFSYESAKKEETHRTATFELSEGKANLEVRINTSIRNNWAYFPMALVNEKTGEAINFSGEVGYWTGVTDGERWSSGSQKQTILLGEVPGGRWYLIINANSPVGVLGYSVQITRDVLGMRTFWFCLFLLVIPFSWFAFRNFLFEKARWQESDHPYFESE